MKYSAFISYRHSELDTMAAQKIHKELETFRIPKAIREKLGRKRIGRVFIDQEELPVGSDLDDKIRQALEASEFLIIICSPRAKQSYWVCKEIETFIELHGRDKILAVLIEGEPEEAFPELILQDEQGNQVEPLAADLRETGAKKMQKKLKTETMRLAAPLLGCTYDDLRQRYRERKMRKWIAAAFFISLLAILFGAYSSYNAMMIQKNFAEKQVNQSKYMAEKSAALLEYGDRRAAVLVALEAMPGPEQNRPYVAAAEMALSKALRCYDIGKTLGMDRVLNHELQVKSFEFYANGSKIVSIDDADAVYVWNVSDGKRLQYIPPQTDDNGACARVENAGLNSEGNLFAAIGSTVMLQSQDGTFLWQKKLPSSGPINSCRIDEQTDSAVCTNWDGEAFVVDMKSGEVTDIIQNPLEYDFFGKIVCSDDKSMLALAHYVNEKEQEQGFVSIYSFETKQLQTVPVSGSRVIDVCFTDDNQLVVMSGPDEFGNRKNQEPEVRVEKIEIQTGTALWSRTAAIPYENKNRAETALQDRSYPDAARQKRLEHVHVMAGQEIHTLDAATGETVSSLNFGENLISLHLSANSSLGFAITDSGVVHFCDLTEGKIYYQTDIRTGKRPGETELQNGVLALREPASDDIVLMAYTQGYGMKQVHTFDTEIAGMCFSENGTYYAVEERNGPVLFYTSDTDTPAATWKNTRGYDSKEGTFLDDTTYLWVDAQGGLFFYDVQQQKESFASPGENRYTSYCLTDDKHYILFTEGSRYLVVDLQKRETVQQGTVPETIYGFALSKDGTKAVFSSEKSGFIQMDFETQKMKEITLDGHYIRTSEIENSDLVYSQDGRYVACSCTDNMLRVVDMQSGEIVREIPFYGESQSFFGFVEGTAHLLTQGEDSYIRVYDVEQGKLIYTSVNQCFPIWDMYKNRRGDLLNLKTDTGLIMLSAQDYQMVLEHPEMRLFSEEKGVVFCVHGGTLYRFPYMDENMLYQEAERQFPSEKLTTEERIRFNID